MIFILTDEVPYFWKYEKRRIDETMIEKYCFPFKEKFFSLCGPLKFIESITTQLKRKGVLKDHIEIERFK